MGYHLTNADTVDFRDNGPADPVTKYTVCHPKTAWGPIFIWVLSTKYTDSESGLVYYGYRYYVPESGRWTGRDPIGEEGGISLTSYVLNDPIGKEDALGEMAGSYPEPDVSFEAFSVAGLYGDHGSYMDVNSCTCSCNKASYDLKCSLSLHSLIRIARRSSSVWEESPASYPTYPTPKNWSSMNISSKVAFVLGHERKHYAHYKAWYDRRKYRIEGFEMLKYPSLSGCNQRAAILTGENTSGHAQVKADQKDHVNW